MRNVVLGGDVQAMRGLSGTTAQLPGAEEQAA